MNESQDSASGTTLASYLSHLTAEERWRLLVDHSFDWVLWRLPDGSFEYVSPACQRVTGYKPEDFIHNPQFYYQIIHPEDRERIEHHRCRAGRENLWSFEFRITSKEGQERWIEHVCCRLEDSEGHFLGCRISNRDITVRKHADNVFRQKSAEARQNSRLLQWISGYTPIGIAVVDSPQMKVHLISRRGCELEGRSREELDRFTAEQYRFIHPDGTPAKTEEIPLARAVFGGELVIDEEWQVLRPDGVSVNILCNAGPIVDDRGQITGGVMVWQDITRRKQNEKFHEHSRRKLIDLKEELENKNKELETIIGTVSHDLRSPLVSIQGFSHEIQLSMERGVQILDHVELTCHQSSELELIFEREIPEFVGYIKASATAMDQLVKSLVKVARAGMAEVNPEQLDMDELLSNVTGAMGFTIKEAQMTLDLQPLPDCWADRQQVTHIFSNLLDNAIKFRKPDAAGFIRVSGCLRGDFSCYTVEDNGIGIPQEFHEKVFNLFDRLPGPSKGEGIGLAVVKRMVERNGGKVHLISEPGKGSSFIVLLPSSRPAEGLQ